jgi:hypothetical protein
MDTTNNVVLQRTRKGGIILAEKGIQHHGSQYKALKGLETVPFAM